MLRPLFLFGELRQIVSRYSAMTGALKGGASGGSLYFELRGGESWTLP